MLIYEARVLQGEETVGAEVLGWKRTWCLGVAACMEWSEQRGSGRRRGHTEVGGRANHRLRSGFRCYLRWKASGEF